MFESRFQSFVALGDPSHGRARVAQLRAELAKAGLAGFIVPRADEHQNEYVPANAERLRWLTGFAGSAGLAVVLKDAAALFVDGRYTEQVKTEADAVGVRVPPCPRGRRRPNGSRAILSRATSLAMTRGFTRPTPSRDMRPPARRPAPGWLRSTRTRSTRSGRIGRPRRSARSRPHKLRFAGESAAREDRARAAGDGAVAGSPDQRSSQSGVAIQHSRLRRLLHARCRSAGPICRWRAVRSCFSTEESSRPASRQ